MTVFSGPETPHAELEEMCAALERTQDLSQSQGHISWENETSQKTPINKELFSNWAWWSNLVVPALWKAETQGLQGHAQPGHQGDL